LQRGRGRAEATIQKQRSADSHLTFKFRAEARSGSSGGGVVLTGPFTQGPPAEGFVYIDIGTLAGHSCWSRRLKIPLTEIITDLLRPGSVLETRAPGTAKDGGPRCATVKPFRGWKPRSP